MDNLFDNQAQRVENFVKFIEKNIIEDIIVFETKSYDSKMKALKEKIKGYKETIQKQENYQVKRLQKYTKIYTQSSTGEAKKRKDLYNWENKYKASVYELVKTEQKYGELTLSIWDDIIKLEKIRMDNIQRAFKFYIQKYIEVFGKTDKIEQTLEEFVHFNSDEETQKNYDIMVQLDQWYNQQDIRLYFQTFEIPDVKGTHRLVQRIFEVQRDVGAMTKKFKPCELIFTVDQFILVYEPGVRKELKKPDKKLLMEYVTLKDYDDKERNKCYMIEDKPGMIFTSTTKILLKFIDEDELDMFKLYLKQFQMEKMDNNAKQ